MQMKKETCRFLIGLTILLSTLLFQNRCDEELEITEFVKDYEDYESELRIEAVLVPSERELSVVRIDRTILVTDTSLHDGLDEDGDWIPFMDENGNGQWDEGEPLNDDLGEDGIAGSTFEFLEPDKGEGDGQPTAGEPHVDEYDEILPAIHVRDAQVGLYDPASNQKLADFSWTEEADSFDTFVYPDSDYVETYYYGAYKPSQWYLDSLPYYRAYEFRIETADQIISGTTVPIPPVRFENPGFPVDQDTLIVPFGSLQPLIWKAAPEATVFWIYIERIYAADSLEFIRSMPSSALETDEDGYWVGKGILGFFLPGLYRWTISVPDPVYGAYFYSELPMRDRRLSNLRDQDDNVVLGIAGSASNTEQYVRVLNTR